jgi:hypothetical protein
VTDIIAYYYNGAPEHTGSTTSNASQAPKTCTRAKSYNTAHGILSLIAKCYRHLTCITNLGQITLARMPTRYH